MRYIFTLFFFTSFLPIFLTQCQDSNSDIPVPAYIEINDFKLTNENALGITDVWVNVNGNLIGVFGLPAKFPVIANGPSDIKISAGIKVNGISATRTDYPFYQVYVKNIDLKPSETYVLNPQSTYNSWTNIEWEETFEGSHKFIRSEQSDTIIELSSNISYEGSYAGMVNLDTTHRNFLAVTPELTRPDLTGAPGMYLELNYKCDNAFRIGLYIYNQQNVDVNEIILIKASEEWKKIYIDLYNPLLQYPKDTPYRVFITSNLDMENAKSTLYFDNFRIVQSSN